VGHAECRSGSHHRPHCTDNAGTINGFPITCPRNEGSEAIGPDPAIRNPAFARSEGIVGDRRPKRYCTFAETVEFAFNVNEQVFVLLPPLEQAPDQIASRPFVTLSVMAVPVLNELVCVLPTGTFMPASRGKCIRSEPVAALYEQGRVSHVGGFPQLEDQMCLYGRDQFDGSPDRVDALVYALTDVMIEAKQVRISVF
jgi:hypothetical protein